MIRLRRFLLPLAITTVVAAGCGQEAAPVPEPADPEYDGLSREQIEEAAESMTPEEAERLGIVDTTIRIEPPIHPDSVPEMAPPPGSER